MITKWILWAMAILITTKGIHFGFDSNILLVGGIFWIAYYLAKLSSE
jgi:hypothetical protein